jgi:hypothetical protein
MSECDRAASTTGDPGTRGAAEPLKKSFIYMQLNKCVVCGLHCWVSVPGTVEFLVFASTCRPCLGGHLSPCDDQLDSS